MFWKTKLESEGMEDPEKFVKMWKKCVKDLGSGGVYFLLLLLY